MKNLTKLEMSLTLLLAVFFLAMMHGWLIETHDSAHLWKSKINPVSIILFEVTLFSWLIFTIFYLIILCIRFGTRIFRKRKGMDKGTPCKET